MRQGNCSSLALLAGIVSGLIALSPSHAGSIVQVHCGPACDDEMPQPNTDFIAVSTGNYQTLGLRFNGSVAAWGFCGEGSCVVPSPNSGFTAIASGDAFNLFMRPGGIVQVSGNNEYAQHDVPQPNSGYVAFAAGLLHAIALRADGSIAAWGYCGPQVPVPNSDWIAVAAGGYSSMGLKADGTLYKWGCFFEPGQVIESGTRFKAMACHADHALAVREDGSIFAWGNNNQFGQLNVPKPNADFVAVAATYQGSAGLKADGSIVTWGNIAAVVEPNNHFASISADNWFIYGIRSGACDADGDCDDGEFCNGAETCDLFGECQPASFPCGSDQWCDQSGEACVPHGDGDFNESGTIDLADYAMFQQCFGKSVTPACAPGNLAGADGMIDAADLMAFVGTLTGL